MKGTPLDRASIYILKEADVAALFSEVVAIAGGSDDEGQLLGACDTLEEGIVLTWILICAPCRKAEALTQGVGDQGIAVLLGGKGSLLCREVDHRGEVKETGL